MRSAVRWAGNRVLDLLFGRAEEIDHALTSCHCAFPSIHGHQGGCKLEPHATPCPCGCGMTMGEIKWVIE